MAEALSVELGLEGIEARLSLVAVHRVERIVSRFKVERMRSWRPFRRLDRSRPAGDRVLIEAGEARLVPAYSRRKGVFWPDRLNPAGAFSAKIC